MNKVGRTNIYMNFINKTKNYFNCCSDSRKRLIFFGNADTLEFFT